MNLISKKELLAMTGISYGQLYRWKRENLIPEEWFIKKASYTGQETFFPREQILSRVQSILEAKDRFSLEELAQILTPHKNENVLTEEQLARMVEVSSEVRRLWTQDDEKGEYTLQEAGLLVALSQATQSAKIDSVQLVMLLNKGKRLLAKQGVSTHLLTAFAIDGNYYLALSEGQGPIAFDEKITIVGTYSLEEIIGKLQIRYQKLL